MSVKFGSYERQIAVFFWGKSVLLDLMRSFKWAWLDIVCRYRRSRIGPLWETINVLVLVSGITVVSSAVLGAGSVLQTMPYVGLGVIGWSALTTIVTQGSTVFMRHGPNIRGTSMSLTFYIGRTVFESFITFCHHSILYFVAIIFLPIELHLTNFLGLIGILLLYVNALWVVPFFGFISARFRDVENIVRNLMQLSFFVTPVFWNHQRISPDKEFIVYFNPFFYFLEIIRTPLLGGIPPMRSYLVVLSITAMGYILLYLIYRKMRGHLAFHV